MKCEKCASEMPGSMVKCAQCGFNHATTHVDRWKAQRQTSPSDANGTEAKATSPLAAKVRARYATEAKLLQFPVTPKAETSDAAATTTTGEPAWREQLKGRVREHLEKRKTEEDETTPAAPTLPSHPSDEITSQLIVESALKRIRRSTAPPPALPVIAARQPLRGGQQALARAYEPEEELLPEAPPPVELPERQPAERLLEERLHAPEARRRTSPEAQPVVKLPQRAPVPSRVEFDADADAAAFIGADAEASFQAQAEISPEPVAAATTGSLATPATKPLKAKTETLPNQSTAETNESRKANVWVGKPAPLWLRATAGALDLEAAALAYLPFFGMYTSLDGPPGWSDIYFMVASLAVVVFLYELIMFSFNSRTIGMAICGLRCVDMQDASATIPFQRRWRQALGGTVALLCPPANYVVTRVTSYERGLGDALAQTITLRKAQD